MRKARKHPKKVKLLIKNFSKNEEIFAPTIRLINDQGQMLGVMTKEDAFKLAEEKGLDLVEVSPKADPPVVKIIEYGKFQYQQEKLARKQKANLKKIDIKGIRLSLRIGEHDLQIKIKQAKQFLIDGQKIKVELNLRGRERQFINEAFEVIKKFIAQLGEDVKLEQPVTKQSGRLTALLAPKNQQ